MRGRRSYLRKAPKWRHERCRYRGCALVAPWARACSVDRSRLTGPAPNASATHADLNAKNFALGSVEGVEAMDRVYDAIEDKLCEHGKHVHVIHLKPRDESMAAFESRAQDLLDGTLASGKTCLVFVKDLNVRTRSASSLIEANSNADDAGSSRCAPRDNLQRGGGKV